MVTPSPASPRKSQLGCPILNERRQLELEPGVPVLTVLRTAYDADDVAVEICDTVKAASAYLLEYDFPAR